MVKKRNVVKSKWDRCYVGLNLDKDKNIVVEKIYVNRLGDLSESTILLKDKDKIATIERFKVVAASIFTEVLNNEDQREDG